MRQGHFLPAGLLIALVVGCTTPMASTTIWERLRPFQGPTGPDVVQMDVALIELPVGDPYLNRELWAAIDEQAVALEHKSVLEDNGLRVGIVAGITPGRLQSLLTSDQTCANPRHLRFRTGTTKALEIGPVHAVCRFYLTQDGEALPVDLEQATCTFEVQPSLTRDGKTRLTFTPRIQHGERRQTFQPSADRTRWEFLEQRSSETYTSLAWDMTLSPNEFVVVGAREDRRDSLGHHYFVRADEPAPVQRLLVIRTNRPTVSDLASAEEDEPTPKRSPSLAAQAAGASSSEPRP